MLHAKQRLRSYEINDVSTLQVFLAFEILSSKKERSIQKRILGFGTWGMGTLATLHDYLGIKSKDARVIKLFGRETCSGVYWGVRWWVPSCAPSYSPGRHDGQDPELP